MSETVETSSIAAEPTKEITRFRDFFSTRKDLGGFIDPRLIRIDKGHNPRDYRLPENRMHLDSLKISIASAGVLNPLQCRLDGGQCILVNGECRLTAVLELIAEGHEIKTVPVMQVTADNEADRLVIAIATNTGKPLSEWELGGAFKRLRAFGWEDVDIAGKFGMTAQKVAKCIELEGMPIEVKQLLSERAITPALAISTIKGAKRARKTVSEATEELKSKAAKQKADGKKGPAKAAKGASKKDVAAAQWEIVGRSLYKSALEEWNTANAEGAEKYDWISVRFSLFKKLAALVEGTK